MAVWSKPQTNHTFQLIRNDNALQILGCVIHVYQVEKEREKCEFEIAIETEREKNNYRNISRRPGKLHTMSFKFVKFPDRNVNFSQTNIQTTKQSSIKML